jgi:DNA-binding response OmpR family regulator
MCLFDNIHGEGGNLMRVLVVEDEKRLANILRRGLIEDGYAVDVVYDGEEAEFTAESAPYDLIILDVMLPKKDGISVCRYLRSRKINIPILMLTAKDSLQDRITGLDSGADDYLIKPFEFAELTARVRALLRRESSVKTPELRAGDLVMDTLTREVRKGHRRVDLTGKEYSVLEYFLRHPNQLLTRTTLESKVWDYAFDGISNIIDVFIGRLRKKIDETDQESVIQTVRGAGYRLKSE